MASIAYALSIQHFINSVGAKAGFASIIGLALLVLLFFTQSRETANLRRRADEAEQQLYQLRALLDRVVLPGNHAILNFLFRPESAENIGNERAGNRRRQNTPLLRRQRGFSRSQRVALLQPQLFPKSSRIERLATVANPRNLSQEFAFGKTPALGFQWNKLSCELVEITAGFGRSDNREHLRRHFEVNAESVVAATLSKLAREGKFDAQRAEQA